MYGWVLSCFFLFFFSLRQMRNACWNIATSDCSLSSGVYTSHAYISFTYFINGSVMTLSFTGGGQRHTFVLQCGDHMSETERTQSETSFLCRQHIYKEGDLNQISCVCVSLSFLWCKLCCKFLFMSLCCGVQCLSRFAEWGFMHVLSELICVFTLVGE